MSRGWKLALGIVALVLAVNAVEYTLRSLTGGSPGGPDDSSYATGGTGAAAYAELLTKAGHPVRQVRVTPSKAPLAAGETAVVLDPSFVLKRDALALREFVAAGGRLVAGGGDTTWLKALVPGLTASSDGARIARPLTPVPEVAGVRAVVGAGLGSWSRAREALPVLGRTGRTTAAVARIGRGRVVLLADESPLENAFLGRADNARFALDAAGPVARPVVFFESYHGYGSSSGLAAIPSHWQWLFGLLAFAVLLFIAARFRRFGPPEDETRLFPPARVQYVESLAGVLERTHDPAALDGLKAEVRRRADRRGSPPLEPDEQAALARTGSGRQDVLPLDQDVLPLGRALARLAGTREGSG